MVREVFQVDDLVVDRGARTVLRGEQRLELPRLSFDLLLALIDASPDAVSVEALMDTVWKGVVVSPATVAKRVELLRQALDDSAEQSRYIELVRSYGYRLAAPARLSEYTAQPETSGRSAASVSRPVSRWWIPALVAASLLAFAFWIGTVQKTELVFAPQAGSIAVLPFQALSDDREDQWFAEGLAEELNHALAKSGDLQVAGRTSVNEALARGGAASAVGELLGVSRLLEGSVSRESGRLRVRVRLVSTEDGLQRWSETFEMPDENAFALQKRIAEAVEHRFAPEGQVARAPAENSVATDPETYALYLKAVRLNPYPVGIDLPQAQRFAEEAVARDPQFAPAWSILATIHLRRLFFDPSYTLAPADALATIRGAVDRALAIDPGNANAYATLSGLVWAFERDMQRAAELLEQAVRLDPHSLEKWSFARDFARSIGDLELARELGQRVVERDPLCATCRSHLAGLMRCLGDPEEERHLEVLIGQSRESPWRWDLGKLALERGEIESAEREFRLVPEPQIRTAGQLLVAHARGAWTSREEETFQRFMDDPTVLRISIQPGVASRLGRHDLAMETLFSATRDRYPLAQSMICDPDFEPLHTHPDWPRLMATLGFNPDGSQATQFELPPMPDSAR